MGRFEALNPISILTRGFSVTTTLDGKIIKKTSSIKKGDLVNTKLADGSFKSEVKKIVDSS